MTKYTLESTGFEGKVTFGYSVDGHLLFYDNNSKMTSEQVEYLLKFLPLHINHLTEWRQKKGIKIVEMPADLSFDRFWQPYTEKLNKKRCIPLFESLNDHDKMLAIVRVTHYLDYCKRRRIGVANPEKYLRERYFENDYLRLVA